MKDNYII